MEIVWYDVSRWPWDFNPKTLDDSHDDEDRIYASFLDDEGGDDDDNNNNIECLK